MSPKSLSRAPAYFAVPVVLLQLVGCHGTTGPAVATGVDVRIQTDRRQYSASTDPGVHVSMVNVGSEPVYAVLPSAFVSLEMLEDGRWRQLGGWYGTLAVAPGVVTFATGDSLPAPELSLQSFLLRHNGTYRFVYQLYEDAQATRALPQSLVSSNAFEVVD